MQTADLLKSEGYKDLGYTYVIIGDCWMSKTRDKDGNIQADKERFPSGMKALADYVSNPPYRSSSIYSLLVFQIHRKDLKFGLYENVGELTCAGYPGVKRHIKEDVQQFVAWEVDYIKLDGCLIDLTKIEQGLVSNYKFCSSLHSITVFTSFLAFIEFGRYLNETGRPVVYSCGWPAYTEVAGIPVRLIWIIFICVSYKLFRWITKTFLKYAIYGEIGVILMMIGIMLQK